jgi:uncharacterized membrane protein YphA (DoxX/SURF4 family)
MLKKLFDPLVPYVPVLLRVFIGATFLIHGLAKLIDPGGFIGWVSSLGFPIPVVLGWSVMILETAGGLMLILGFGTRWIALALALLMLTTAIRVKASVGFIAPSQLGAGAELDLMMMAGSLALAILGSGPLSVDRNLLRAET